MGKSPLTKGSCEEISQPRRGGNAPLKKGAAPKARGLSGGAGKPWEQAGATRDSMRAEVRLSRIRRTTPRPAAPPPPLTKGNLLQLQGDFASRTSRQHVGCS